jgi:hypothetical protein
MLFWTVVAFLATRFAAHGHPPGLVDLIVLIFGVRFAFAMVEAFWPVLFILALVVLNS